LKRSKKKGAPQAQPGTARRVTMSHVVLIASGMVLMFLLESLFWPGRGLFWRSAMNVPAANTANTPPWGQIEYVPIALDRPEDYFTNDLKEAAGTVWVFRNHTEQQLSALFASLNLEANAQSYLTNRAHWEMLPRAIRLSPPPEVVISLSAETRRQLYELLAHNPENWAQAMPFRFRASGFDDWFANCGLPKPKIDLVRKLTYTEHGNLCFADAAAFSQLSTAEETQCLVKSLWRVSTFVMKVRVDPKTDVEELMKYWGTFSSGRAYKPLVESMSRVPEGSALNVSYFLPPFARLRLYTYPDPGDTNIIRQDCFWSSMNFFNVAPDNGFFNPEYTRRVLKADYGRIADGSRRFGDLLLLLGTNELALHMCVYLADDVVFTKNGANIQQPWVLMRLPEMLSHYEAERPYQIVVYRRKTPAPNSALQVSSFASAL
jgi:hypothetical protein